MIKNYNELNSREIEEIKLYSKNNICEIVEESKSKVYNLGEGILFAIIEGKVVGSIRVVLETVKWLNVVYIHFLNINDNVTDKELVVNELIEAAIKIGENKGVSKILFGIRDENILEIVTTLGYSPSYSSYIMALNDRNIIMKPLELIPLLEENKKKYLNVYNSSFSDMPHGSHWEMDNIDKYLFNNNREKYYLVKDKDDIIGFLNIDIEGDIGSFDIGLCKEFRGRGYGKRLLETAIDTLNKEKVEEVKLTVIEKNSIAFNMYKKRGFIIEKTLSHWIVIKG